MWQLPNVADTVERVRGAVLSIVAESIVLDRFGNQRSNFGSGTGVIFSRDGLAKSTARRTAHVRAGYRENAGC